MLSAKYDEWEITAALLASGCFPGFKMICFIWLVMEDADGKGRKRNIELRLFGINRVTSRKCVVNMIKKRELFYLGHVREQNIEF